MSENKGSQWVRLSGLWESRNKPGTFIGKLGTVVFLVKKNDRKDAENQPDYVLLVCNETKEEREARNNDGYTPF